MTNPIRAATAWSGSMPRSLRHWTRGDPNRRHSGRPVHYFECVLLELGRPIHRGMLRQHATAGPAGDLAALGFRHLAQDLERLLARAREQDLAARFEDLLEPRPAVADDRRPASGRFEQSNAG